MKKNQFQMTREMFAEAMTAYQFPMTYEEWMNVPDDYKCAALFINFYDTITLAWQKQKVYFLEDEDAVSMIIQYLLKNVDKIKEDPKRYKEAYIFTVAARAIIGFVRPMARQEYYDNYQGQYFDTPDGGEKDIFEIIEDKIDRFDQEKFCTIMANLSGEEFELAMIIISARPLTSREMNKYADVYDKLREAFAEYQEIPESCAKVSDNHTEMTESYAEEMTESYAEVEYADSYEVEYPDSYEYSLLMAS